MTKPTKWHVRPAKTQISLDICPVWSESSMCAQWVAQDPSFLHADSEDWSDWADAQADLSLRWVSEDSFCWFLSRGGSFSNSQLSEQNVYCYKNFHYIPVFDLTRIKQTELPKLCERLSWWLSDAYISYYHCKRNIPITWKNVHARMGALSLCKFYQ